MEKILVWEVLIDTSIFFGFNPLLGSIDINLKSNFVNTKKLDSISRFILKKNYIDEII